MPTAPAVVEVLRALKPLLSRWGGDWYVFGAQAVIAYGIPRLTDDVDVTAWLRPDDAAGFVRDAARCGFELRVSGGADFARRMRVLPFSHAATGLYLDVVLAASGLEAQFLKRSQEKDIGGVRVRILSPTDLVIAKVLAGRPKDIDDARGILKLQGAVVEKRRVRRLLGELESALDRNDLLPVFETLAREVTIERGRARKRGKPPPSGG